MYRGFITPLFSEYNVIVDVEHFTKAQMHLTEKLHFISLMMHFHGYYYYYYY